MERGERNGGRDVGGGKVREDVGRRMGGVGR